MRAFLVIPYLLCLLPGLLAAQRVHRTVVLHNGYEAGQLVRNHTVVHYYHNNRERVAGFITVNRVVQYALNQERSLYSTWVETDTLCTFAGTIHKGRKNGTFPAFPPGNLFFVHTYEDDQKNGPFLGFFHFGQRFCEGTLTEGIKTGPYREYYANGHLSKSQQFLDPGKNVLHQEQYYITGELHHRGYFHGDNKVNEWQYFDTDGTLSKTEYYNKYGRLKKIRNEKSDQD